MIEEKLQFENLNKPKEMEMIEKNIEENRERILAIRHQIHENPELGFHEFETAKLIKEELERLGVEILAEGVGKTGVIARIKGRKGGKMIALRADMDALPIQEKTDLPYASKKEGVMHACGHDTQTSALLGAAGTLKKLAEENKLDGDVLLVFQPNEERSDPKRKSGAVQMIKALEKMGLRDKINAFFALHVYSEMERGKILLPKDMLCGSSSSFKLKLEAPGGHASESWKLPNIEKILAHIEARLDDKFGFKGPQSEQPRIILEPGLHKTDSQAVNILAEKGETSWTLRILLPGLEFKPTRTNIIQELKKIITDEAEPWQEKGAKWTVDYNPGTRPVAFRDPKLVELSEDVTKNILGKDLKIDRQPILGGEDFSYYPEPFSKGMSPKKTIPGAMILVGGANPEKGIPLVGHHKPNFKIDEEAVIDMAKIYAEFSRRYLEENK